MKTLKLFLFILPLCIAASCGENSAPYEVIDEDANQSVDREEYLKNWHRQGFYTLWDRDGDGRISEEEWNMGLDEYYEDYVFTETTYGEWDMDQDAFLDKEELAEGIYTIYDTDGDGDIDSTEYNRYHEVE